jgi:hypothetical protein
MIESKEISVVVQGAVNVKITEKCIESIRQNLPDAEIILSTWENAEVSTLDYDEVVINRDPGGNGYIRLFPEKQKSNLNRQLVSSLNGLKQATRKYALKIRTDMMIQNLGFLKYYELYGNQISKETFFKQRVMVDGIVTLYNSAFSIGDWWTFGLKDDLIAWYSCPLSNEKENDIYCFEQNNKPKFADVICQYPPEQYICYNYLKKYYDINYDNLYCNSSENIDITKNFIIDNLICIEYSKSGIVLEKAKNIVNPISFEFNLPLIKWVDLIRDKYEVLPGDYNQLKKEEIIYHLKYKINPDYWNEKQWINIIDNYSSRNYLKLESNNSIIDKDVTFIVVPSNIYTTIDEYVCTLRYIRKFCKSSKVVAVIFKGMKISKINNLYDQLIVIPENEMASNISSRTDRFEFMYLPPQIIYMKKALKLVDTKYVCRIRVEMSIKSCDFISNINNLYRIFNGCNSKYKLFEKKIIVSSTYSFDSRLYDGNCSFTVSDIFQFGTCTDMKKLWGEFHDECVFSYFDNRREDDRNICKYNAKYLSEQILIVDLIKRNGMEVDLPYAYYDKKPKLTFIWEAILSSNFIIVDNNKLKLTSKKCKFENNFMYERYMAVYMENIGINDELNNYFYNLLIHKRIDNLGIKIRERISKLYRYINPIYKRTQYTNWTLRNSLTEVEKEIQQLEVNKAYDTEQ